MPTFLDLVNDVCGRVNETQLEASNFSTASGFYSTAKEAINSSIRFINQHEFEWPFNHNTYEQTLTPGVVRYAYPAGTKTVDFESFRIKRSGVIGNTTQPLQVITYEEYLSYLSDAEYNTSNDAIRALPYFVFRTPDLGYGVYPAPDSAYTLVFERYILPTDLVAHSDTPTLPDGFRHIVIDGAMYYVYFFRGDIETADRLFKKFEDGIKNNRSLYINRYDYIRDTRVSQGAYTNFLRTN
jgi:hypothetical protein